MKSLFTAIAILFFSFGAIAQNKTLGCIDSDMRMQSEELKNSFTKQGLVVFRDAMLNMDSETPIPIVMPMAKGKVYQMIFIGNKKASNVSLEVYNSAQKLITTKQTASKSGNNYIVYSFIPEKDDDYRIMLSQRFKGRSTCGSFTLMQEKSSENNTAPPAKK